MSDYDRYVRRAAQQKRYEKTLDIILEIALILLVGWIIWSIWP